MSSSSASVALLALFGLAPCLTGCDYQVKEQVEATKAQSRPDNPTKLSPVESLQRAMLSPSTEVAIQQAIADERAKPGPLPLTTLEFLHDVWNERRDLYPTLAWGPLTSPIIRLEIAEILMQARRQGDVSIPEGAFHAAALRSLGSADGRVRAKAMYVVGLVGNQQDIPMLEEIAMSSTDPATFRAAALALTSFCGEEARTALNRISQGVQSSRLANPDQLSLYVQTLLQRDWAVKQRMWCGQRPGTEPVQ